MSCLLPSSHAPSSSWPPSSAAPPWTRFETGRRCAPPWKEQRMCHRTAETAEEPVRTLPQSTQALGAFGLRVTTSRRWGEGLGTWDITAPVAHLCAETPASGRCARRLIAAEGILAERIAGGGEGAGARAAAALSIFAAPTAAGENLHASERAEEA